MKREMERDNMPSFSHRVAQKLFAHTALQLHDTLLKNQRVFSLINIVYYIMDSMYALLLLVCCNIPMWIS